MRILIVGDEHHVEECKQKLGSSHAYTVAYDYAQLRKHFPEQDVIFDFIIDEDPEEFDLYADLNCVVFLNTAKMNLAQFAFSVGNKFACTLFGFNGLPTFFNRAILEVSCLKYISQDGVDSAAGGLTWDCEDTTKLNAIMKNLGSDSLIVDDRVGLVTPRVICMIINEAYYTVQEGTASREDIDIAMKLGTNYPFGPFEWCQRIGIRHVYELLEAVYDDTKDERYKICPLLKREYLSSAI
jgi:3-hydroxybutyryl-CoA dehydrogenase